MFGNKSTFPDKGEAIDHSQLKRLERLSRKAMLSSAKKMDPIAFEHLVGALFERMGYDVRTTVASGDDGVDLYVRQGRRTAVVQCKRYQGDVGSPQMRDLYGTMLHNNANEAYMVTTGNISNQARRWAEGKPIQMIDGFALVEWISALDQHRTSRRWGWVAAAVGVMLLAAGFVYSRGGLPVALDALAGLGLPTAAQGPVQPSTAVPTPVVGITPTSASTDELPQVLPTESFPTPLPATQIVPTGEGLGLAPTPLPTPEIPISAAFEDDEIGFSFIYDNRWLLAKQEVAGRIQGVAINLTQQGYGFRVQAQTLPFAVALCPTPTAKALTVDYRSFEVNGVTFWRPAIEEGVVAVAADGTPLPISVFTLAGAGREETLCAIPVGKGFLAISYLLPDRTLGGDEVDRTILAQMDTMLQSLRWEDSFR